MLKRRTTTLCAAQRGYFWTSASLPIKHVKNEEIMMKLDVLGRGRSLLLMAKFGVDTTVITGAIVVPIACPLLSGTPGAYYMQIKT